MVFDSHLHFPPVGENKSFDESKTELLAQMDKAGIDYAIVIPDSKQGSAIGDLETVLETIDDEDRLFALGAMDVKAQGAEWLDKLDEYLKKGHIKGMKIFPGHEPLYPTRERYKPLYELCQKYNQPLVIHTGPNPGVPGAAEYNDPKYIIEVAQEYPELKIVIAHYFWPRLEYCYDITRGYENIYFDTSALADEEVIEKTGKAKIKKVLEKTIRDDPRSVLFGSDFSMCTMRDHINLVDSLDVSEKEKERVFWKNAVDLFSLRDEINF